MKCLHQLILMKNTACKQILGKQQTSPSWRQDYRRVISWLLIHLQSGAVLNVGRQTEGTEPTPLMLQYLYMGLHQTNTSNDHQGYYGNNCRHKCNVGHGHNAPPPGFEINLPTPLTEIKDINYIIKSNNYNALYCFGLNVGQEANTTEEIND